MITTKWVNTESDDGALPALLQRMEVQLPADAIHALWIFPTRRAGSVESTVIVAACGDPDPDRRRVYTARFTVVRDKRGRPKVEELLQEHATAPADALSRVVDGVVRRIGDEAAQPPRHAVIDADPERFDALIVDLGGTPVSRHSGDDESVEEEGVGADAESVEASTDSPPQDG
jgi:hypothetical protein